MKRLVGAAVIAALLFGGATTLPVDAGAYRYADSCGRWAREVTAPGVVLEDNADLMLRSWGCKQNRSGQWVRAGSTCMRIAYQGRRGGLGNAATYRAVERAGCERSSDGGWVRSS